MDSNQPLAEPLAIRYEAMFRKVQQFKDEHVDLSVDLKVSAEFFDVIDPLQDFLAACDNPNAPSESVCIDQFARPAQWTLTEA